jgi:hypothetical protein
MIPTNVFFVGGSCPMKWYRSPFTPSHLSFPVCRFAKAHLPGVDIATQSDKNSPDQNITHRYRSCNDRNVFLGPVCRKEIRGWERL